MAKKRKSQKQEIIYHIINSALAGGLVLLGSFTTGQGVSKESFFFAFVAAAIVCLTRFKEYWDGEKGEYTSQFFNIVG